MRFCTPRLRTPSLSLLDDAIVTFYSKRVLRGASGATWAGYERSPPAG